MKAYCTMAFLLLTCAASADEVAASYKDPTFNGTVTRILVVGAHEDRNVRGIFENSVVRALRAGGADGESSLARMGSSQALSAETLLAAAERAGADAVLVTRVLSVDTRESGDEEFAQAVRPHAEDPLQSATANTVRVGSDLYTVANQTKVWSAESTTFDKANLFGVIDGITTSITAKLRSDRLIRF
jgi:transposase